MLFLLFACSGSSEIEPAPVPSPAQQRVKKPRELTPTPPAEAPPDQQPEPPAERRPNEATGPDCPEGVVLVDSWPGEYPVPVIEVEQAVALRGRPSPCERQLTRCRLEPGIYHPWATSEQDHGATYSVVRAAEPWEVLQDVSIGGELAEKGTVVEVHGVLAEGMCLWWVPGAGLVEERCADLFPDKDKLQALQPADFEQRKLFQATCRTGNRLWIDADEALLAMPGVREGRHVEQGSVGPAE